MYVRMFHSFEFFLVNSVITLLEKEYFLPIGFTQSLCNNWKKDCKDVLTSSDSFEFSCNERFSAK